MLTTFTSKLIKKEKLTDNVYLFVFEQKGLKFEAGQYVILNVPYMGSILKRLYSIASPMSDDKLSLYIEILPSGKASSVLAVSSVGDEFVIQAPAGRFLLSKQSQKKRIFIATGTGIAPFLSMIPESSAQTTLLWGLKKRSDVYALDILQEYKNIYIGFDFTLCLSRETELKNSYEKNTRVTQELLYLLEQYKKEGDLPRVEFYLCGSHLMIDDVLRALEVHGVDKKNIFHEKFTSSAMSNLLTHEE
jgi:ferredoxin-NADP reductase